MKPRNLVLIVSILVSLTIGCSSKTKITPQGVHAKRSHLDTEARLANAADSISSALTELASIEKSNQGNSKLKSPIDAELIGMNQLTSVDWSGPVEPLARKLAGICKYKLNVLGTEPGIPVLISITAKNMTVADILRDINFQCASKANIEIYPASKLIELRYNK